MKKIVPLMFFCLIMANSAVKAVETLSFRFTNPRIIYNAGDNYLTFDIQMKATANGTYLYSSQVVCNVTSANFNTATAPSFIKGFINGQFSVFPNPPQDKYNVTANWNSGNLNIAIYANSNFNGQSPSGGAYSEVTTSWQILGTVYLKISVLTGTAGVNFRILSMDGFQKYATGVSPSYSDYYTNPNLYIGSDFTDLYLGRIYSGISGWTQSGGTVNWSSAVNTSVWDTASSASVITGTTPGTECLTSSLRIHYDGRLRIDKDHPLTATGPTAIETPRGLCIGSGAAGTGSFLSNGTVTYKNGGTISVDRYITGSSWHYISSPLQDAVAGTFLGDYLRSWDEPLNAWSPWISSPTQALTPMMGYEVWLAGASSVRNFTGKVNEGSISQSLTYTASGGGGWSLTGNPYPCSQDFGSSTTPVSGWTWPANVDKILYFLTSSNGSTWQYNTYSWGTGTGTGSVTRYIPPMQGYFVKVNTSSAVIGCNNQTKIHSTAAFYKDEVANMIKFRTNGAAFSDENVIFFNEGFTSEFDHDYDAYKFSNGDSVPTIYSVSGENINLAIDVRNFSSETTIVPLGFSAGYRGSFTITAEGVETFSSGIGLLLEDVKEHVFTDLRVQSTYAFSADPEDDKIRFLLHAVNPAFGIDEKNENQIVIYEYNGCVYMKSEIPPEDGTLSMYDISGRKVFEGVILEKEINSFYPLVNKGIYIVTAVGKGMNVSQKILFTR